MLETAVLSIFTVLIFLSIVMLSYYIALKILHPKGESKYIILIVADKNKRNVADTMYSEKMRLELLNDKGSIIVLDCGMDDGERKNCADLCRDSSGMYVVSPDKINELISKEGL